MGTRTRDTQRSKVYAWERECWHEGLRMVKRQPRPGDSELRAKWYAMGGGSVQRLENEMTLSECKRLALRMMRKYLAYDSRKWAWWRKQLRIKDGRGRSVTAAAVGDRTIKLPRWGRQPSVVAHEAAHIVIARKSIPKDQAAHGPEFVWIYTDMLARYHKLPVGEVRKEAREHKVKIRKPVWA